MRKAATAGLVMAIGLGLAGCGYTPEQRATSGALIGAAGGSALGAAAGGGVGGALAGGVLGAATGAIIGGNTRPPPPRGPACRTYDYDYYGRPVCTSYYAY